MPASPRETVLCRYRYDPLDSLVDCAPVKQAGIQRFYCKSRLATEIQGAVQRSVFQHDDQLLAQRRREDAKVDTTLLATDQQRSVLNVLDATGPNPLAYTPYGHRPTENGLLSLLGFNGERPDPVTGHYLLGNGYRAFNPVLMRFNSPDSLSPFGEGGLNAYGYCGGDSINRSDPTGHFWGLGTILKRLGIMKTGIDIGAAAYAAEKGAPVLLSGKNINPKINRLVQANKDRHIRLKFLTKNKIIELEQKITDSNVYKIGNLLDSELHPYQERLTDLFNAKPHGVKTRRDAIENLKRTLIINNHLRNAAIEGIDKRWTIGIPSVNGQRNTRVQFVEFTKSRKDILKSIRY